MNDHRIGWLDSFRFLAVTGVLFYHLTNPLRTHYHQTDFFLHIFKYGFLGVNLFFMISGFVISLTLERTPDFLSFQINRFCRLFPAMFLCSLLTCMTAKLIDIHQDFPQTHQAFNLLPGFSFINPQLWTLVSGYHFSWINGSYWTLWTELQFYLLASSVYFLNRKQFFRNFTWIAIGISLVKYVPQYWLNYHSDLLTHYALVSFFKGWSFMNELFNLDFFITWFLLGVLLFRFYKLRSAKTNRFFWLSSILVLACMVHDSFHFFEGMASPLICGTFIFCGLFFLMIYRNQDFSFPGLFIFRQIGIISYSVYLIHEIVGILLINTLAVYLGHWSFLTPFLVISFILLFSALTYRFYERPATRFLKRMRQAL